MQKAKKMKKCDFSFPQCLARGSFVTALAAGVEAFYVAVIRTGTLLQLCHLLPPGIEKFENVRKKLYSSTNIL
jgi:hypothetical protein